jgi:hypothetical protein
VAAHEAHDAEAAQLPEDGGRVGGHHLAFNVEDINAAIG